MIKLTSPDDWSFGEPTLQLIKVASRGLRGDDLSKFVKRAGHEFATYIDTMPREPGEELLHLIALGSTEKYGANRNADGFNEDTCKSAHGTFVKSAKWYRSHKNKDKSKSYGIVKRSSYDPMLGRIDLLVSLNGTEKLAKERGGLVADEELKKLAKHSEIATSMGCNLDFDLCSSCGNKAKHRGEYCLGIDEGGQCKHGGCRNNLGKLASDGHLLYVENPNPTFFDISHVFRPADRIAYAFPVDYMKKVAAHEKGGAALAESLGVSCPLDVALNARSSTPAHVQRLGQILCKMAAGEQDITTEAKRAWAMALTRSPIVDKRANDTMQVLAGCAEVGAILPIKSFLELVSGETAVEKIAAVASCLPEITETCSGDADLFASLIASSPFATLPRAGVARRRWAEKHAADCNMLETKARDRARLAAIRGEKGPTLATKTASTSEPARQLAGHYMAYKLAALERIQEQFGLSPLTATLASLQNYI